RILGAAALRGVYYQGATLEGDAGESARHHRDVLAHEHVRPQVDVTRLEASRIRIEGRMTAETDYGLGDVVRGIGADLLQIRLALGRRRLWADEHAVASRLAPRFDHERLRVVEHESEPRRLRPEVCWHVGQDGLLAEVVANHGRHVAVHRLVVSDAGAHGVGEGNAALAVHLEQPGGTEH